ncbi:Na+-driven multidrug efflux pump [Arcticibacter tournemirensis]|uniref:Oligosaccharide flippase family protein n=1 Tax=Arcticibacter tournemirensis TaxID=699437 RepID=A0A5M9H515_9SPHI|nr:oligosaccharide flippase family protein [Arcticibacter tournemirensis]KAA8482023.1 oligosaccharide flippase family protein [Arcticibacter tournemirensis]TQM49427.1 Na+-driven multidrug efflux pump [Arcticibacter tournemirensis]
MASENNKRIAKNTLLLYVRMIITMVVSLYTVRVILGALGTIDYGIYNVVGGIVVMFSFLSTTMAAASQRFFAYHLGRNDLIQMGKTFNVTLTIYIIVALVVLLLAETVGLWFLNNYMSIPYNRVIAANWIYQFAILSFIATILVVPYNASIIAHENMKVYAYVSIIEAVLKLLIVYVLFVLPFDKLKTYAVLMFITTSIVSCIYITFCIRKYSECRFQLVLDRKLFKDLLSYSGWNLFGALATISNSQGTNILLNVFFGPSVNASRAIAFQVSTAINQFVTNFLTAVNPQITKYYATGEKENMLNLVFRSSKLSYFLLFILSMPMLLETHFILALWLKVIPPYVVIFAILVIIAALIDSLSYPLMSAAQASGKIRLYQTVVGSTLLLNLPVSYVFLKYNFPPDITMYIAIGSSLLCLFLRLIMLRGMIDLRIDRFLKTVIVRVVLVTLIAYPVPLYLRMSLVEGFSRFLVVFLVGTLTSICAIYFLGLSVNERLYINDIIKGLRAKINARKHLAL